MKIEFNGKLQELQENTLLAELLKLYHITEASSGLAIALNGKIARRAEWRQLTLQEGDSINVLHAVQGG